MNKEQLDTIISKIDSTPGQIRGFVVEDIKKYIKEKEGLGGLEKFLNHLEAIGFPADKIACSSKEWINFAAVAVFVSICKDFFHWTEDDIYSMGKSSPQIPAPLKIFVSLAMDPKKLFKTLPVYWDSIFDFGIIEPIEFEEQLQHVKIAIKKFDTVNKDFTIFFKGYLVGVVKLIVKAKKITIEDASTKKEEGSLEYVFYWQK